MSSRSEDGPAVAAPPWTTTRWFRSDPLDVPDLRGRVVVLEAFQMLCPGCVSHALPQALRLVRHFGEELTVIGLHSVFEHHAAMTPTSLEAFLYEYRIRFPVGVDAHHGKDPMPVTFSRYQMRGTPSTVLIDRDGRLRGHHFGAVEDMAIASAVTRLLDEAPADPAAEPPGEDAATPPGCAVDGACTPASGPVSRDGT